MKIIHTIAIIYENSPRAKIVLEALQYLSIPHKIPMG